MMAPHWLDNVIDRAIQNKDPAAIARAVSHSERFMQAIEDGLRALANKKPGAIGPSDAQYVRKAIQEAIESST